MGKKTTELRENDPHVQRVAWFADLEHARTKQDYKRAAEALGELERLGVTVRFKRHAAEAQQ